MKILITGSNNYIANDIIELFSKDNKNEIIATYNKKKPRLKKKNIKLIKIDLTKKINLLNKIQVLIHCASATPYKKYNILDYKKINILGFIKILNSVNSPYLKHIILFSTVSVYGKIKKKRLTESHPLNGYSEYAKSKKQMENILTKFCKKNKLNGLTLRFPGVLGTRKNNNNFLSMAIKSICDNQQFKIFGLNNPFNNMIGTKDIYRIIRKFLKTNYQYNKILNCCVSEKKTILEIIKIIENITKKKAKFKVENKINNYFTIDNKKLIKSGFKVSKIKTTLQNILVQK
jgi:UDP-glucuronate 4-epimerase